MTARPRTICVVTGSRAEYGLLFWLLKAIAGDPELKLQLAATGMHLSPEFGLTVNRIEQDGFTVDRKVEMLLSADSPVAIAKSVGLGVIGFADALADLNPDLLVILGDRFEIFAAAQAAMILRIPIAHIHGGELTEGAVDEAIRHALTKMSHLHFTAAEAYRQRVIQLGEAPERVFNTGAPGLDHIGQTRLLERHEFEQTTGFTLGPRNVLVTFHPVTLEQGTAGAQFNELLSVLESLEDAHVLFTLPNADTEGRVIIELIQAYHQRRPQCTAVFSAMGSQLYLSALQLVDVMAGNSSSGIIEAPAMKTATVNIGDRQKGRLCADSIIHCRPERASIQAAFEQAFSAGFGERLASVQNPYGNGGAAGKMVSVLKQYPLDGLLKKPFYDIGR